MESIRKRYRQLRGKEPGRVLVVEGELEEQVNEFIRNQGPSRIGEGGPTQEYFIRVSRTAEGYEVNWAELQKSKLGIQKTYFEEQNTPIGYLKDSVRSLGFGDELLLHVSGDSSEEIAEKLRPYFQHLDKNPSGLELSAKIEEKKLDLEVKNTKGIHARPAALIVKHCSKYDADIEIELRGNLVSAKSIMGLMTLEAKKGDKPTFYISGPDTSEIINGLRVMFEDKFDED